MDVGTMEFHLLYVTNDHWVEAGGAHASKIAKRGAALFRGDTKAGQPPSSFPCLENREMWGTSNHFSLKIKSSRDGARPVSLATSIGM